MKLLKISLFSVLLFLVPILWAQDFPDIRTVLNSQIGNSVINIPPGTYSLDLTSGAYTFSNLSDVRVEGNGSTIICNRQTRAFNIANCENFTIADLAIDYDPLCFTQGTITSVSSDYLTWDIKIHGGYPVDNVSNTKVLLYDSNTRELKENYLTIYAADFTVTQTGDSTFRVTKNRQIYPRNEVAGDYVVLPVVANNAIPHTIYASDGKNLVFDNVTIYGSNSFSFFEAACENTTYTNCVITRKPNDPNVAVERLMAGNADGIHSKFATVGPTIEGCTIEYIGDDCIAINGNFYPVYAIDEANAWIYLLSTEAGGNIRLKMNDSIVCFGNEGLIRGKSQAGLMRSENPTSSQIQSCINKFSQGVTNSGAYVNGTRVKISPWINGIAVGDMFYAENRIGSSFSVKNNTLGHTRSRGILVKSSNGIIQNNDIERCDLGGIIVAPEVYWMEAGCSNNLDISNNTIKNCLYAATNTGISNAGAISLIAINGNNLISPVGVFDNISVYNNTIEGCPRPCVVLTSAKNLAFYDNNISPNLSIVRNHGSSFGITNNVDVWTKNVEYLQSSVHEIKSQEDAPFDISFNPDNFTISFDKNEHINLSLYNLLGSQMFAMQSYSNELVVDTSNLSSGYYILKTEINKQIYTKKILINNY